MKNVSFRVAMIPSCSSLFLCSVCVCVWKDSFILLSSNSVPFLSETRCSWPASWLGCLNFLWKRSVIKLRKLSLSFDFLGWSSRPASWTQLLVLVIHLYDFYESSKFTWELEAFTKKDLDFALRAPYDPFLCQNLIFSKVGMRTI